MIMRVAIYVIVGRYLFLFTMRDTHSNPKTTKRETIEKREFQSRKEKKKCVS